MLFRSMLAPTEILARQHYETLRKLFAGLGVEVAILTGRDKGRVRDATLMGLADGSIDILLGTHALFQHGVDYRVLGLVVVDEQELPVGALNMHDLLRAGVM